MTSNDARRSASTLERIVPEELAQSEATGRDTLRFHVERYEFAAINLVPGTVLDLACGTGYGSNILASSGGTTAVTGVDISEDAIRYATEKYQNPRVTFVCSSAAALTSCSFENVVSLETIEHVEDPDSFFAHLVSLTGPGGRLITSVPTTPSVDANPHHKTNFSSRRFRRMGEKRGLTCLANLIQVQRFNPLAVLMRREERTQDLRNNMLSFYFNHPSHLGLRLWSILTDGFCNKYLTLVWEKPR